MDSYCQKKGCKAPQPDKPKPPPAKNNLTKSQALGGSSGTQFTTQVNTTTGDVSKFVVRCGLAIDNLQLLISDGIKSEYTEARGGTGGGLHEWAVPQGQHITEI